MSECIICGTPTDGPICSVHEEDVAFEFTGDSPDQLTPGRYYRGTVDGFAEFGVFVDIGDSVTGLLHRSELDTRIENLDWEEGDEVYVQVTDVRDNGDIDLGWSIRQSESEFRGSLVDTPEGTEPAMATTNGGSTAEPESDGGRARPADGGGGSDEPASYAGGSASGPEAEEETDTDEPEADDEPEPEAEHAHVESLEDRIGDRVRLEGEIVEARQTSGPTVFRLRDETGSVECAAFEEAGVRAYPEADEGDVVALVGEVRRRRGDLQVETESLEALDGEDREAVTDRMEAAFAEAASPGDVDLLADHPAVESIRERIVEAATRIRRAVMDDRPVLVRHTATADGYVAGAAIERAVVDRVHESHDEGDAEYHLVKRRPLDEPYYDMDAATDDVTNLLEAGERHDEAPPLIVLVDLGSTLESRDAYRLLDLYDAERLIVDAGHPDPEVAEDVSAMVNPGLADGGEHRDVTTAVLAADVAAHVSPAVRADLEHLPAISYRPEAPDRYADLASEAGYDAERVRRLHEAVALEAHYQSYNDKRELIADLLFDGATEVADHVSEQFRRKVDTEVETAAENLAIREARGVTVGVLDTEAFTHRFDFPPTDLLLDELHRQEADDEPYVTVGIGKDELHLRSTEPVDVREVTESARDHAEEAGLTVVGGRDGHVAFLAGEREEVLEAVVAAVTEQVSD